MSQRLARMHLQERTTLLDFDDIATVTLPVGMRGLVEDALRHDPPTPAELEQAIDLIEDALATLRLVKTDRGELVITDAFLRAMLGLHEQGPGLALGDVEVLFQRLAIRAHGAPVATAELPHGRNIAAALLILRECMHHLGFDRVL